MKKIIFLCIVAFTFVGVKAQRMDRLNFATTLGTGISINTPSHTPLTWQVLGYYHINQRLSVGAGTGLSIYEKALIPVFADTRFSILKPRKFTPYLECSVGYSFASDRDANGGLFLNPSVGIQYSIQGNRNITFALGYELQKFERLKRQEQSLFCAEFVEKLSHKSISIKIGFIF